MNELKEFIQTELKEIIFRNVDFNEPLLSTKVLDSISLVDLIVAIEEYAGVSVPTGDVTEENFDTIDKISEYISSLKE